MALLRLDLVMIESPGSGGASGCRKNTGNRIDTGTGLPRVFAGSNLQIARAFHRRGIQRVKPGRLGDARRISYDRSIPVDDKCGA